MKMRSITRRIMLAGGGVPRVASIAVMAENKTLLLMGKRKDNGLWTLPGGHLESEGEVPFMAGLRELFEETGIEAPHMVQLDEVDTIGRTGAPVHVTAFLLSIPTPVDTVTSYDPDEEVASWHWINVAAGLPAEIKNNLHSPRNVVLEKLGLLPKTR